VFGGLAKLMVARGMTYAPVSELLKSTFLKAAQQELLAGGAKLTDSRLSLITGIHRKDVRRLRQEGDAQTENYAPPLSAQVVAAWLGNSKLLDKSGAPVRLVKKGVGDQAVDFENLVKSLSKDIRPRAVLDELIDRKIVSQEPDGYLRLHPNRMASDQDGEALALYLGMNVSDHITVAVNNLLAPQSAQLERCVHYHGLSEGAAQELADLAEKKAMEALIAVNQRGQELIEDCKNHGTHRINFGAYFLKEPKPTGPTTESPK
jgi:hypothetical protein